MWEVESERAAACVHRANETGESVCVDTENVGLAVRRFAVPRFGAFPGTSSGGLWGLIVCAPLSWAACSPSGCPGL